MTDVVVYVVFDEVVSEADEFVLLCLGEDIMVLLKIVDTDFLLAVIGFNIVFFAVTAVYVVLDEL